MKNKKLNFNNLPYMKGYQDVDLTTGHEFIGQINFKQSVIDDAVFGLTEMLIQKSKDKEFLDEIKNEKHIKKSSALCWTCGKSCGMCVCEKSKKGEN